MKFEFELTEQDYIDFNMFYMYDSKYLRRQIKASHIICTIIPVLMGIFTLLVTDNKEYTFFILMIVLSIVILIFFPKLFKRIILKKTKKYLFEKKNTVLGNKILEFDEEGINEKTSHGESVTKYSAIIDIKKSDKAIYLFNTAFSAFIIPVRVFTSVEEKEKFLNFIKEKVR